MHFRPYLLATVALSILTLPAVAQETDNKWGAHVEAEGKWGTERSLGEVGVFIPVWQDEDSLLFGNIIGRLDNNESHEGNFGVGFRQQVSPDWAVGAYGFYDRRKTETGNHFNQGTMGVEAFRDNMEFRVNGYIPESDEKTISGTGGAVSTAASASGGNLQLTTTTTGARRERALGGVDAEAGYKFNLPDNWEAWAYAGGYHFDADGYENVTGPRGRVEVSYNNVPYLGEGSRFTVGLESQTDDVRDDQHFGIARVRIPLNGSTTKSKPTLSPLDQRMTTRIVRDVDVVSGSPTAAPAPASVVSETANVTLGSGTTVSTYTVIDQNTAGGIFAAVNAAGTNALILIDGSAGAISAPIGFSPLDGQTIIGGGGTVSVTGATSGRTITLTMPGTRPTLNGNINNAVIAFTVGNSPDDVTIDNIITNSGREAISIEGPSNNLRIQNLDISNTDFSGMRIIDVTDAVISNVNINTARGGTQPGIVFSTGMQTNVRFENVNVNNVSHIFSNVGTVNNPTGSITGTNFSGNRCNNTGTINNSALFVNGLACP